MLNIFVFILNPLGTQGFAPKTSNHQMLWIGIINDNGSFDNKCKGVTPSDNNYTVSVKLGSTPCPNITYYADFKMITIQTIECEPDLEYVCKESGTQLISIFLITPKF